MALTAYEIGGSSANAGGTRTVQNSNNAIRYDTSERYRYYDLAYWMQGDTGANGMTSVRAGVITAGSLDNTSQIPNSLRISAAGSGLNVNVARGGAMVDRTTKDGPYLVASRSVGTVTLASADPTNSRIDGIYLQVLDGGQGDNAGVPKTQLLPVTGTGSVIGGVIQPAAAPVNSILLGTVTLTPAASTVTAGMIRDLRKSTAAVGSVRVLLPGDSLTDPGFMVGELRDTTAIASSATIDRWNTVTAAWQLVWDGSGAAARYNTLTGTITGVTSNASYVGVQDAVPNLCGVSFVAPASGITRLDWGANARTDTDNVSVFVGVQIRQGSTVGTGTVQSAVVDGDTCQTDAVGNNAGIGRARFVTGLTPGASYNAQLMWRIQTTGHTGNCGSPWISTQPIAA